MTSQNAQTPRRRFHGASVVVAVAVLLVLVMGGAFAVGQATADSTDRPGQAASTSGQYGPSGDYGPMMGWAQGHHGDPAWMRDHMNDVAWMRHHDGQWQWMRDHPGQWSWMRGHWDDMARLDHRWEQWNDRTGSSSGNPSGRGWNGGRNCW